MQEPAKEQSEKSFGVPLWVYLVITIPLCYDMIRIVTREAFNWSWSRPRPVWFLASSIALVWLTGKLAQDYWEEDGGWSPRTVALFVGVILSVSYCAWWIWLWIDS